MVRQDSRPLSSGALRLSINSLNLARAERFSHETTFGRVENVIYRADGMGCHGNFLDASYRRICADAAWSARLKKVYTASSRVPRAQDRRRGELECANSSDALLMNIFCYPRILHQKKICILLGVAPGIRPEFGVRAYIPMQRDEVDRTELDMRIDGLLVEAKLTESSFGMASMDRVLRYRELDSVFDIDELPRRGDRVLGYQLIRGVLAAHEVNAAFALLCDHRRLDLVEMWFRVLQSVRHCDIRSRMLLLHWQELAACSPPVLRRFLQEKYGIAAA